MKFKRFFAVLSAASLLCGCTAADMNLGSVTEDEAAVFETAENVPQTAAVIAETTVPEEIVSAGIPMLSETKPEEQHIETSPKLTDEEICALDCEKKGFGQGLQVDELNRPLGGLMFNADYTKYDGYALDESDKAAKQIYLTFDQGYENGFTAPILDTLKEKNVKAVFFLTGDYAERNKELVRRMIDEGHVLGNHGMKHASIPTLSAESIEKAENEIMSLHEYVKDTYGYEMKYFRPPCGEYSERSVAIAQRLGYKTLFWSFAYADWDVNNQPDCQAAFERISGAAHGGGIFLLHSVSETNCTVLPQVIDSFREQGFELTVPSI